MYRIEIPIIFKEPERVAFEHEQKRKSDMTGGISAEEKIISDYHWMETEELRFKTKLICNRPNLGPIHGTHHSNISVIYIREGGEYIGQYRVPMSPDKLRKHIEDQLVSPMKEPSIDQIEQSQEQPD